MPTIGAVRNKAGNTYIYISGCSSVWLERVVWDHEAAGSSPVIRTSQRDGNVLTSLLR